MMIIIAISIKLSTLLSPILTPPISINIIILSSTVDVKCGASSPESESESLPPNISEVNEFFEFALWKLLGITFLNEFYQKIVNATINSITMFSPLSSLSLSASPMIVNDRQSPSLAVQPGVIVFPLVDVETLSSPHSSSCCLRLQL